MYPRPLLTVTVPPVSTQLTTLAQARAELALAAGDTSSDAWLSGAIDQVSGIIVDMLNRPVAAQTVTETFRLGATAPLGAASRTPLRELVLACAPVTLVASVIEDGSVLLQDTDFEADAQAAMLYRLFNDDRTSWSARRVDATYTGGWLLPNDTGRTLPAAIERACLVGVSALYAARGRDPLLRSESVDLVGSSSWLDPAAGNGGLPATAMAMLEPFRRITVA